MLQHTLSLLGSLLVAAVAQSTTAQAPNITGTWRTPTGSVVEVFHCADAVCLRVLAIEKDAPGSVDANNPDPALRSRSLCGLEVGTGFHSTDGDKSAEGGQLYDPKNGKTYSGSLALNGSNQLKLRGYVGVKLFGRTEDWIRATETPAACH